jgi:putative flippase GtrA
MLQAAFRQFACFSSVGVASAVGHYGLLILLVQYFGMNPIPTSALGALLGALINYLLNYRFTFRSAKRHTDAIFSFAVVATVGLLLNTFFMWIAVRLIGIHYLFGQVVTSGLVLIWSFLGNRYWTFHVESEAGK